MSLWCKITVLTLIAWCCTSWGNERFWLGTHVNGSMDLHRLLGGVLDEKGVVLPDDMELVIQEADNAEAFFTQTAGNALWLTQQFAGERVENKKFFRVTWAFLPVVIAVHADCPVDNLSVGELKRIYSGRTAVWPGGTPVRLGGMAQTSMASRIFRKVIMQQDIFSSATPVPGNDILPDMLVCRNLVGSQALLESVPGMIVFGDMQLQNKSGKKYKILRIDNVEPTVENIVNGRYPVFAALQLVGKIDRKPEKFAEIMMFLCRTAQDSGRFVVLNEKKSN